VLEHGLFAGGGPATRAAPEAGFARHRCRGQDGEGGIRTLEAGILPT
jgi:hypothetical protein